MSLQLPRLTVPVLAVDAELLDGGLITVFRGTADLEAKPELDQYVEKLHEEAQRLNVTKVIADFRELEFMNSSSFKVFVMWLSKVQAMAADRQYRIHFRSNPKIHWQRRSLAALSCFAVDLVTIET